MTPLKSKQNMKISVVGGGPAGLYFATSVKAMNPKTKVVVYEANKESVHSLGLGYTLQHLGSNLLMRQNPNFREELFAEGTCMTIEKALFKTTCDQQTYAFSEGFSVTRAELMRYLVNQASKAGVNIKKRKLTRSSISKITSKSDLTVGADGVNSILRNQYATKFGAQSYKAKLKYSWFINESPQVRTEACFYAFQAPEGVITLTSYPLSRNKQVVIIEMSEKTLQRGRLKGRSPEECTAYLSEILSLNGDDIRLTSAGLPWYSFTMNIVNTPVYKNIALIGDAAFSYHFSFGQGVSNAFTSGYLLAQCLAVSADVNAGLNQYANAMKLSSAKLTSASISSIRWLENIDEHFDKTSADQQIDHFRLKGEFNEYIQHRLEQKPETGSFA